MRIFLSALVLIFCFHSSVKADTIREFQIEGIGVGDSLLEFFNKSKINKFFNYDNLPSDMKFRIIEIYSDEFNMRTYDAIQVVYKPDDKNFIIYSVSGILDCSKKNINCELKFNNIKDDLRNTFYNIKPKDNSFPHFDDKSGNSIIKISSFDLLDGRISITYTNWTKKMKYSDNVGVEIHSREVSDWIENDYGTN